MNGLEPFQRAIYLFLFSNSPSSWEKNKSSSEFSPLALSNSLFPSLSSLVSRSSNPLSFSSANLSSTLKSKRFSFSFPTAKIRQEEVKITKSNAVTNSFSIFKFQANSWKYSCVGTRRESAIFGNNSTAFYTSCCRWVRLWAIKYEIGPYMHGIKCDWHQKHKRLLLIDGCLRIFLWRHWRSVAV